MSGYFEQLSRNGRGSHDLGFRVRKALVARSLEEMKEARGLTYETRQSPVLPCLLVWPSGNARFVYRIQETTRLGPYKSCLLCNNGMPHTCGIGIV